MTALAALSTEPSNRNSRATADHLFRCSITSLHFEGTLRSKRSSLISSPQSGQTPVLSFTASTTIALLEKDMPGRQASRPLGIPRNSRADD